MDKPIGGRGRKAPYETTHVRIPVDLKSQVEELVNNYRNNGLVAVEKNNDNANKNLSINYDELVEIMIKKFKDNNLFINEDLNKKHLNNLSLNLEQSIEYAKSLLSSARTKKAVAQNLLTAIYQVEVKL
jgi:hypothetical protein